MKDFKTLFFPLAVMPVAYILQTTPVVGGSLEDTIIKFIATVGIPASIALYVLVRLENAMKEMATALMTSEDRMERALEKNTQVIIALFMRLGCDDDVEKFLEEWKERK